MLKMINFLEIFSPAQNTNYGGCDVKAELRNRGSLPPNALLAAGLF